MADSYDVKMRIVSVAGICHNGHRAGEEYLVDGKTPKGVCMGSFSSCLPYIVALRFGASFPWEKEEGAITVGCPDPENQVVWRLQRCSPADEA